MKSLLNSKGSTLAGKAFPGSPLPSLCSVRQAASALSVSGATIRRMLKAGTLRKIVLNGKTIRIRVSDIADVGGAE